MVHGPPDPSGGQGGQPRLSGAWHASAVTGGDTIVAVATPAGAGAVAIVRISGPDAVPLAARLVRDPAHLTGQPSHRVRRVVVLDASSGEPIDEALCTVMRAPRSYTGEDVVELSCHGSPALLRMVIQRLCAVGARLAAPGEFTRRAFLNGRLDLAQAEAVALLIGAQSDRAVMLAARAMAGGLGARVARVRDALLDVVAGLEVSLDFPDEGVGVDGDDARRRVGEISVAVDGLVAAARRGRLVQSAVTVALVGRPNAGKSSLLNALVGNERAIVAPTPGTTRDIVEGTVMIAGLAVRVLDTAGLGIPGDALEAEGMRRARAAIDASDIVVVVVDGTVAADGDVSIDAGRRPVLTVRSKSDLPVHPDARRLTGAVAVSAATGAGLAELEKRLAAQISDLIDAVGGNEELATSLRQREELETLAASLRRAVEALGQLPLEVVLVELREGLVSVSQLLGVDLGDAVLDRVFATFCVGK